MLVTTGSITTAVRLAKIIERETGSKARVIQTPPEIKKGGCSHSVRFNDMAENSVSGIIKQYGLNAKKMYREGIDGTMHVWRDLS